MPLTPTLMNLLQINLQQGFGGGEVYTCFFGRALRDLGQPFDLVVSRKARWWREHDTGARHIHVVSGPQDIPDLDFPRPAWLIYHTPDGGERLNRLQEQGCRLASFVHMPLYQRKHEHFCGYDLLIAVSGYVLSGLLERGLTQAYPEPFYGVAHLDRPGESGLPVVAHSRFNWDTRKVRDRVLSWVHPLWQSCKPLRPYTARPGLTLGIVSRITPIKQFPVLFESLAPALAARPQVNLEIFGSGGYASIRDTRRALAPLGNRVRWWGEQRDVRQVYPLLDYLLTGLPEKEALGLNILEAQMCGTPILAPNAPPFTETIAHGRSGYLYADPRQDGAHGFASLLDSLLDGSRPRPDPLRASDHLARFSETAFRERVARLLATLQAA
ncbi:MAG: glycosyltransferase [Pseudomonadota bacterium]|nr:glycosyltransferase [Pseudomonadota bacterium]